MPWAIREPSDTSVNCYRAVESIRREYLDGAPDEGAAKKRSWDLLREVAGVEESEVRWLRRFWQIRVGTAGLSIFLVLIVSVLCGWHAAWLSVIASRSGPGEMMPSRLWPE